MRSSLLMSQESPASRAGQMARQLMFNGSIIANTELLDRLDAITATRLAGLAEATFIDTVPTLAAIGPVSRLPSSETLMQGGAVVAHRPHYAPPLRSADPSRMGWLTWVQASAQPVLNGPGILLRMPRPGDYERWRALREESRAFLTPWEPSWSPGELSRPAFRLRLSRYRRDARERGSYTFFVFDPTGRFSTVA